MSSIVSSVICPLIKLWLRSQVEAIENLEVKILGANRQILQGQVPQAEVCGQGIMYQGLSLSNINLVAAGINLNVPQILKGQPLKLLEPIKVQLDLSLEPQDLKQCLSSTLVTEALGYELTQPSSDPDMKSLLENLLQKLGDQFALHSLTVTDGKCCCQGVFTVAATELS
jgi:LmeA-like phospholipid-binding